MKVSRRQLKSLKPLKAPNSNISATGRIRCGEQAAVPRRRDQPSKSQTGYRDSLKIGTWELLWMLEPVRLSLRAGFGIWCFELNPLGLGCWMFDAYASARRNV
jgi:hypothetical protein